MAATRDTRRLADGWRVAARTEEIERTWWRPDLDDGDWATVDLPHQWWVDGIGDAPARVAPGTVAYRRRLSAADLDSLGALGDAGDARRVHLVAPGVFYWSHAWCDGTYLGHGSGYFTPHRYELTDALRRDTEPLVALEVACAHQSDRRAKTMVTGVFSHWDAIEADFDPGGLWRPVELAVTGPATLLWVQCLPLHVDGDRAVLEVHVGVDSTLRTAATLRCRLRSRDGDDSTSTDVADVHVTVPLAPGVTQHRCTVEVDRPRLWWPRELGEPALHDLDVTVSAGDDVWDAAHRTVGIRDVRVDDWVFRVNGERIAVRGSNYGPTTQALSRATAELVDEDLRLAADAGLNLLRVHGHVGAPALYEAADRTGMLLWQDFPLQWSYARRIRADAERQMRDMLRLLGSHPSIAMWCCHNEPVAVDSTEDAATRPLEAARTFFSMLLPNWNKDVLDPALHRVATATDPSRFCNESSGAPPGPFTPGGDSHLYFGWYVPGPLQRFATVARRVPGLVRFVSEFGAQALPSSEACEEFLADPARSWPDGRLTGRLRDDAARHGLQADVMRRWVDPDDFATFDAYRRATQQHQADVVRLHVEQLRIRKYAPTGGFCQFQFQDSHPSVSWSVVDHLRHPKAGWDALRRACAPVLVCADAPPNRVAAGAELAVDVHVVSDLRHALADCRVTAALGGLSAEWRCDVAADSSLAVGTLRWRAPQRTGRQTLRLQMTDATGTLLAEADYPVEVD